MVLAAGLRTWVPFAVLAYQVWLLVTNILLFFLLFLTKENISDISNISDLKGIHMTGHFCSCLGVILAQSDFRAREISWGPFPAQLS